MYSADFGVGFARAVEGFGCYVIDDATLGATVGYGCDASSPGAGGAVTLRPTDGYQKQLYVASLGLSVVLRNSGISSATVDAAAATVTIAFEHAVPTTYSATRLVIRVATSPSQRRVSGWTWLSPAVAPPLVRGAFELPQDVASITLQCTRV